MKQIITGITLIFLFASCKTEKKPIVSAVFIDSLISNYSDSAITTAIKTDIQFWGSRINPSNPGFVNEMKYAAALVQQFHVTGDIIDVKRADSILHISDNAFDHKQAGPIMALVRNSILQHRFKDADSLLTQAKLAGLKTYESAVTGFDVAFELGYYPLAENELKKIADLSDYGFNFRHAKLAHYNGEVDTAINAMQRAATLAGDNIYLKQAALSNQADLNLHNNNLQNANDLYEESIRLNVNDLHSMMGLGWIALVHDHNDTLAEKIFQFVRTKTKAPDIIFKLIQVAAARADTIQQKKWANEFDSIASQTVYGNMYNKYLLQLYTGILQQPAKAEQMARQELKNRTTPQTYAWYVWSLYSNGKTAEAENIYQQYVSGKPLEGLELFWMGKFMKGLNKDYNAGEFFKAAFKNRYDLSVSMVKDLEKELAD